MLHDLMQILRMDGVQDVEKIIARRTFSFRKGSREEWAELGIFLEVRPKILDAELIVVGYLYEVDRWPLHDLSVSWQNILDEIFINTFLGRQVILYYKEVSRQTKVGLRCCSKYVMKSCFDFNLKASSSAIICCMVRFFEFYCPSLIMVNL